MVVKVIGSIIVFLSCTAAGLFFASKDKFRADELREMKRGLILLKSEIDYSSRPLYEALIDISAVSYTHLDVYKRQQEIKQK